MRRFFAFNGRGWRAGRRARVALSCLVVYSIAIGVLPPVLSINASTIAARSAAFEFCSTVRYSRAQPDSKNRPRRRIGLGLSYQRVHRAHAFIGRVPKECRDECPSPTRRDFIRTFHYMLPPPFPGELPAVLPPKAATAVPGKKSADISGVGAAQRHAIRRANSHYLAPDGVWQPPRQQRLRIPHWQ